MYLYHFHGIQVRSGISLGLPLLNTKKSPPHTLEELQFVVIEKDPSLLTNPVWQDPYTYHDGEPVARLYFQDGLPVVEAPHAGIFILNENTIEIFLYQDEAAAIPCLLGRVFALWLELAGYPLLHGCCSLLDDDSAVAFLGDSGTGKSTLGAALVNRGTRLLTDDLIPLLLEEDGQIPIYPGLPMTRIWPDSGEQLILDFHKTEKIHPRGRKRKVLEGSHGSPRFAQRSAPLKTLFVLERHPECTPIQMEPLKPAAALMELVRLSYRPELVQLLGIQPQRLKIMAAALNHVQVVKLHYPTGFQYLNQICDQILETRLSQ